MDAEEVSIKERISLTRQEHIYRFEGGYEG
jgi:hypothetical protein